MRKKIIKGSQTCDCVGANAKSKTGNGVFANFYSKHTSRCSILRPSRQKNFKKTRNKRHPKQKVILFR